MSDVNIQKIILQIGDQEVSLTLDELRKLRNTLNSLYEKQIEYIPSPVPTYPPQYPHPTPIDDWGRPWWDQPTVTYTNQTIVTTEPDSPTRIRI